MLTLELRSAIHGKRRRLVHLDVRPFLSAVENKVRREVDERCAVPLTRESDVVWGGRVDGVRELRLGLGSIHIVVGRAVEDDVRSARGDERFDSWSVGNRQPLVRHPAFISQQTHELCAELTSSAEDECFQSEA